ncbi:MAG: molybdate ABC transporter substrate-binding protein, partial [Methylobacteriaceae bacterium]|nr:molybdate ABC transporter substrate-binding protein [Methylobacteriaceae bacterium]
SADEHFVDQLADAGLARDRGVIYGVGRIALFAPHGSPLAVDAKLDGLRTALAAGSIRRFAIANPQLAPYGRAAEEALRAAGLWDAVRPLLVQGENISQAAQFASGGSAEGGVISLSMAQAPEFAKLGRYALIRAELHAPLAQRMALLRSAGAQAEAFYAYLQSPAAQAIFRRHGFLMPGEEGG